MDGNLQYELNHFRVQNKNSEDVALRYEFYDREANINLDLSPLSSSTTYVTIPYSSEYSEGWMGLAPYMAVESNL